VTRVDPPSRVVSAARALVAGEGHLAILTGAGVSVSAGLPTFRGPHGLWEGRDPTELATPEAFARDPEAVWRWYAARLAGCLAAEVTRAHGDLAALAGAVGATLVTQNVDGLHGVAAGDGGGSECLVELHGSIRRARCSRCPYVTALSQPPPHVPTCPSCGGPLRPDVVWFGEALAAADVARAEAAFTAATLALVVGTSGMVWPAAGLAHLAKASGAVLVLVDPQETLLDGLADWRLTMSADEGVRVVRDALLADDAGA
jgi:NAD-dependent deacetylase